MLSIRQLPGGGCNQLLTRTCSFKSLPDRISYSKQAALRCIQTEHDSDKVKGKAKFVGQLCYARLRSEFVMVRQDGSTDNVESCFVSVRQPSSRKLPVPSPVKRGKPALATGQWS